MSRGDLQFQMQILSYVGGEPHVPFRYQTRHLLYRLNDLADGLRFLALLFTGDRYFLFPWGSRILYRCSGSRLLLQNDLTEKPHLIFDQHVSTSLAMRCRSITIYTYPSKGFLQ